MKLRRSLTAIVLGLSTIAAFAQTTGNETRQIKGIAHFRRSQVW